MCETPQPVLDCHNKQRRLRPPVISLVVLLLLTIVVTISCIYPTEARWTGYREHAIGLSMGCVSYTQIRNGAWLPNFATGVMGPETGFQVQTPLQFKRPDGVRSRAYLPFAHWSDGGEALAGHVLTGSMSPCCTRRSAWRRGLLCGSVDPEAPHRRKIFA